MMFVIDGMYKEKGLENYTAGVSLVKVDKGTGETVKEILVKDNKPMY